MIRVGITGGIGSGKSTVCKVFEIFGIPVYNADLRAKHLMNSHSILKEKILKQFGEDSYLENGAVNRVYLAEKVFAIPKNLEKLNSLVHPVVREDFEQWSSNQTAKYVIKEAALLVEAGSYKELDELIVVTAPEDIRTKRVLFRDSHRSLKQIKEILQNQYSEGERVKYANYLINNDESHLIFPQIFKIHTQILEKAI